MRLFTIMPAACFLLLLITAAPAAADSKPNIICIYADDLGCGELGCYGQSIIKTPHIDGLAKRGMRFTRHYSGSAVCAPSRCVVMTGLDTGHAYIRDNSPWARKVNPHHQGQEPIKDEIVTLAERLKALGYRTAVAGKWGLGGPETEGIPTKQGFDDFFGYHCQWVAHSYYPDHLWHNDKKVPFNKEATPGDHKLKQAPRGEWTHRHGEAYAPDAISEHMLAWIADAADKEEPFFFWYASIIPHVALHVPDAYIEKFGYDKTVVDPKPKACPKAGTPWASCVLQICC